VAEGLYRINVQNDPVNWVDPFGLLEVNFLTEKNLAAQVEKGKKSVAKADWLNSDLKENLLNNLNRLQNLAGKVDDCIHHNVAPEIPGTLTIKPQTKGLNLEGVEIEYKLQF
jgi:hypothetical protein